MRLKLVLDPSVLDELASDISETIQTLEIRRLEAIGYAQILRGEHEQAYETLLSAGVDPVCFTEGWPKGPSR